jgi:hypothetical protein
MNKIRDKHWRKERGREGEGKEGKKEGRETEGREGGKKEKEGGRFLLTARRKGKGGKKKTPTDVIVLFCLFRHLSCIKCFINYFKLYLIAL